MKSILLLALIMPAFAGQPGQPCNPGRSGMKLRPNSIDSILAGAKGGLLTRGLRGGADYEINRQNIDAILNHQTRNASDFINPVSFVTIPGIPASSKSGLPMSSRRDGDFSIRRNNVDINLRPSITARGYKMDRDSLRAVLYNPEDDSKVDWARIDQMILERKSPHTLFNPTPDYLLRELSPDRPDATESPLTVDAGRFALEASLFDYRRDGGVEDYTYGSLNFKAGLTNNTDLQAVFDLYAGGEKFSDLTLRLKHNLWGNDGGDSALATMPFVKIPTGVSNSNDEWEGGIIIPWATDLNDTVGLGLMAEIDYLYDGTKHRFEFLHTAVLGFDVASKTGAYLEYIGIWKEDAYEAYAAGGMNYTVNENLILDFGVQTGLNSDAEDFGFFTGFTKRF